MKLPDNPLEGLMKHDDIKLMKFQINHNNNEMSLMKKVFTQKTKEQVEDNSKNIREM